MACLLRQCESRHRPTSATLACVCPTALWQHDATSLVASRVEVPLASKQAKTVEGMGVSDFSIEATAAAASGPLVHGSSGTFVLSTNFRITSSSICVFDRIKVDTALS